jgi:glyoxylase-like metal-dependent hydrolase (beta-lactamase superfamily II)
LQALAAQSIEIGAFRITHVRAGSYWWDGGAMFGVVPKTLWSKHQPCDELNRIEAAFNCYVVEDGGRRVLIETGGGVRHDERALERMRLPHPPHLCEVLAEHGFDPRSIDIAIDTHLHWDHAGGNTVDRNGGVFPALPNARYIAQRGELMHARERHPRDVISYRPVNYEPLIESGRMQLFDGDAQVTPGIEVRVAPGHNRNMTIVLVRSSDRTWCHLADLVQYSAQITPTWVSGFDLFPLEAIENKTRILGQAAAEGWWCSFGHDPSIAFAKIEVEEGKWRVKQSLCRI